MIKNLVFEGGGILGVAYLGAIQYLYEKGLMKDIEKVAGTSIGAITSLLLSFSLSFEETKGIADSIEYSKLKERVPSLERSLPYSFTLGNMASDAVSVHRFLHSYGWYSTDYMYRWLSNAINKQFDSSKKEPPYTFRDFKDHELHIGKRKFRDLYVVGTDITNQEPVIFSYETTPGMEVAKAVLISMSVPFLFESVKIEQTIYADGGILYNYPIHIFDKEAINPSTLGFCFSKDVTSKAIHNVVDYTIQTFLCLLNAQSNTYHNDPTVMDRTVRIPTEKVFSLDFDIDEETYQFLFNQGYEQTKAYFKNHSFG